jgi:hypothetical protein
MNTFLRYVGLPPLFAAAVLMTGCAGIPTRLKPDAVASIQRTDTRAYLPQETVRAEFLQSGYGAGGGLLGAIVDAAITSGRAKSAEERVEELREQVKDVDFRAAYWQAISPVVRETLWLKVVEIETLASRVQPMTKVMVAQDCALNISTDYYLSQDCRVLVVTTGLEFYLPGKHRQPAAANLLTYYSSEIGKPEGDKAIPLWTANGGAAYRQAIAEAIQESAKLVRYALIHMSGFSPEARRPAKVSAHLTHARGDFGITAGHIKLKGDVLEEAGGRLIFQTPAGHIYSFPRQETEVNYLPVK